jgi:hypothetical protein
MTAPCVPRPDFGFQAGNTARFDGGSTTASGSARTWPAPATIRRGAKMRTARVIWGAHCRGPMIVEAPVNRDHVRVTLKRSNAEGVGGMMNAIRAAASLLVLLVAGLCVSCSSGSKDAARDSLDVIRGRLESRVTLGRLEDSGGAEMSQATVLVDDAGTSYELVPRAAMNVSMGPGKIVEGVLVQRVLSSGDGPRPGAAGFPRASDCERALRLAWKDMPPAELQAALQWLGATLTARPEARLLLVVSVRNADSTGTSTP